MDGRRGQLEIYRDVLQCCSKGRSKSQVMYKCGLSWSQIQGVLSFLVGKKFLEKSIERRDDESGQMRILTVYKTTELGVTLLLAIENVDAILGKKFPYALRRVATATK